MKSSNNPSRWKFPSPLEQTSAVMKRWMILLSLCVAAGFTAKAQDTWTGGAGDGLWSDPANWYADSVPGSYDDVVIGDTPASETVNYQLPSGISGLNSITLTQATAGTSASPIANTLLVEALNASSSLEVFDPMTLGTSASNATVGLTIVGSGYAGAGPLPVVQFAGGLTVNSGGVLTTEFNSSSISNYMAATGNITVGNGGKVIVSSSGDSASTLYVYFGGVSSSSPYLAGTDSFILSNGGVLQLSSTSSAFGIRARMNANLDWAGTIQNFSGNNSLTLFGLNNTIESTAVYQVLSGSTFVTLAPNVGLQIANGNMSGTPVYTQKLTSAVNLGTITISELDYNGPTHVYTHQLTYNGSGTGNIASVLLADNNETNIFQLGSNWNITSTSTNFITASNPSGYSGGSVYLGIDLNGYTLTGTASSNGWTPVKQSATTPYTTWNITSSTGTGTFKANSFNFSSLSGTGTVNVGNNVILQAVGGNSSANILFSGSANSTFLYSGNAAAATPATLISGSAIGNLQVQNGALRVNQTAFSTQGAVAVSNGGTLDLNGSTPMTLTLATGQNFSVSNGALALNLGETAGNDQIVSAGGGTFSLSNVTLSITEGTNFSPADSYQIFSGFSSTGDTISGLALAGVSGYTANIAPSGLLTFTAVPEPSTFGLACLEGFALMGFINLRRRSARFNRGAPKAER